MSPAKDEKSPNSAADVVVYTVEESQHWRVRKMFDHFPPDTGKGQR